MGFFASGNGSSSAKEKLSDDLLHRLECRVCPLDKVANKTPHMKPTGSKEPLVYILGEAPGKNEDDRAKQFVGDSGQLLRARIPEWALSEVRWNNVVRCRPPNNDTPERIETECCRPSIERDIAASKPVAIFGFGGVPLKWAIDQNGIEKWRGRRIPVNIGGHTCWYYAFGHPAHMLRMRRREAQRPTDIGSETERAFHLDLKRAFREVSKKDLPQPKVWTRAELEADVELIECSEKGLARLEECLKWAAKQEAVGVDYETKNKRPYAEDSAILTIAVGTRERTFAFGVDHPRATWTPTQRERVKHLWVTFLHAPTRKRVHNLPFEHEWTGVLFGRKLIRETRWDCSYIQATVLDERIGDRKPGCLGLEFLILQYFGINVKELSPLNRKDLSQEPLKDVLFYNALDAKSHYLLWDAQAERIEEAGLQEVYETALRRVPTLVLTQIKGVPVDLAENRKLEKKYSARVLEAEKAIAALPEVAKYKQKFGEDFSSASNKQLAQMLQHVMGRREGLQELGKYVVDESVLERINHPLAELELRRRKASKRLSTYILAYGEKGDFLWPDKLLHPIINPFGTVSDRTSAEDPNTQNMPKHDPEAKEVRKQICAPEGHVVVSIDYGQIQFRAIAMMSRDKRLVKYIWDRHDVHGEWAERLAYEYPSRVGGKQYLKDKGVMKTFRQDTKNKWTFPLCFGAQLDGIAESLEIPESVLKPIERQWWNEYSGIHDWHDRLRKEYEREGLVRHLSGRLNRAPLSYNQMINYPIQGIESHIVLDAMSRLSERDIWELQPNLEIHDDLTFIWEEKRLDHWVEMAVDDCLAVDFEYINVPLTVEVSVGPNLKDMEEVLVAHSDEWKK